MKKIKVYIITYKRDAVLNKNLQTLWENTNNPQGIEVTVLSNYPQCTIYDENKRNNLQLIFNTTRMPHSWGYLSRDWNFCILDAFKNWENPENTDWCVLAQNDVTWVKDWDVWLEQNTKYDLITQPKGDQCMALNIEAVKKVGFFDERLTTLHFQEADYFIRAIGILNERCSINDGHNNNKSSLNHNQLDEILTYETYFGCNEDETLHNSKNLAQSCNFIKSKYSGLNPHKAPIHRLVKSKSFGEINWYPFFWDGYDDIKSTFIEEYDVAASRYEALKTLIKASEANVLSQVRKQIDQQQKTAVHMSNSIADINRNMDIIRENSGNKISSKEICIVVQGAIDKENTPLCLKSIRKYLPGAEVILSTWENSDISGLDFDKLVLSKDPGAILCAPKFNYYNNINRQLLSTQNGLEECNRKYAMKIRTDNILTKDSFLEYFDKFEKRCDEFMLFKKRLIVLALFSRKFFGIPNPFRICDWVTFGLTEDVKKYYLNIDLVKEPEFSLYFQSRPELIPQNNPSPNHYHRYTTEQYYPLNCFQKFFPEIKMDNLGDFNEVNIKQSEIALVNNFIFLDYSQHGIYLKKAKNRWYQWSIDESSAPDEHWRGFIRHYVFLKDYKKYCDKNYNLPFFDAYDIRRKIKK